MYLATLGVRLGVEDENCGEEKNLDAGLDLPAAVCVLRFSLSVSLVCTGLEAWLPLSGPVLLCGAAEEASLRRKVAEKDRLLLVNDRRFGWSKDVFECSVKADKDRRRRFSFSLSLPACGGASFCFIGYGDLDAKATVDILEPWTRCRVVCSGTRQERLC